MIRKRRKGHDDERIYWLIKHVLFPMTVRSNPSSKLVRSEVLGRLSNGKTYVSVNEADETEGFIHLFHTAAPAWIDMLAVHPESRKKGLGSKLMIKAEEELSKNGSRLLALYVDAYNINGIRFYENRGFHAVQFYPKFKCYQMIKRIG